MRRTIIAMVIALLTAGLVSVPDSAECSMLPCDQANQACEAQADFEFVSCTMLKEEGGLTQEEIQYCHNRAVGIYQGCMTAHGCPIIN